MVVVGVIGIIVVTCCNCFSLVLFCNICSGVIVVVVLQ